MQPRVGTVVKADEEEDAVAVVSVLSTSRHRQQGYMQDIERFLLANCHQAQRKAKLKQVGFSWQAAAACELSDDVFAQAWEGSHTGLLINERLVNCPPQLGPPLQQALFEELQWATEDEQSEASCVLACCCEAADAPMSSTSACRRTGTYSGSPPSSSWHAAMWRPLPGRLARCSSSPRS